MYKTQSKAENASTGQKIEVNDIPRGLRFRVWLAWCLVKPAWWYTWVIAALMGLDVSQFSVIFSGKGRVRR